MAAFVGMLSFSIAVMDKVEIGLDQKLSMPDVRLSKLHTLPVHTQLESMYYSPKGESLRYSTKRKHRSMT